MSFAVPASCSSVHRVGSVRITDLCLDDDQRNAVHEEHDVRDDAALHAAGRVDAELIDGMEDVALRMGEVDELHHRIGLARELVHVHLRLEEERLHRFVAFQQRAARVTQELIAQVIELAIGQPLLAVGGTIERTHGVAKHAGQQPLAKARAQAERRIGGNEAMPMVDDRPAQRRELLEERFLDVEVLRHGYTGSVAVHSG
jgi:hypothetical protein